MRHRLPRVIVVAILAALAIVPATATAQTRPGLPDHFAFGLAAGQGDTWLPESGIPWDFRYQYLAGGVNTGHGWETWNPNGTFASNYATESAQHGYTPMFPYYELLQSNGACGGCGENQQDLTNLNTPDLMRAYYANFALLMQRLGTYGKPALIDVEPDFSGGYAVQAVNQGACFGFCSGRGNDPSLLKASVRSSGFPEVAAFPDTYIGFSQALGHLRDTYAPNVLLGYHVSQWAAGADIGMDMRPDLDAAGMGQLVGQFMSQLGPHDLLFTDPLDRDAGQYKQQFGQNRWWDRQNVTFPNFVRWEQFLHAAIAADGSRPMLLWQVPVGNQYFATENNTNGHFQDNRAEYIFGHIPELIQTGIVGALFGAGNAGNTTYSDAAHDGVTNPATLCTTDGTSTGQICNDHQSTVADDDGGFIRMSGQAYYRAPVSLSGAPVAVPAPAPVPAAAAPVPAAAPPAASPNVTLADSGVEPATASNGADVTLTQTLAAPTDTPVLIDFELYDANGTKVWQWFQDNQLIHANQPLQASTVLTLPDTLPPGSYALKTGAFSPGWGTLYAWNNEAGSLTLE